MATQEKTYRPGPFIPNTSYTGEEPPVLIYGENMWIKFGRQGTIYAEGYTGNQDINEIIPSLTLAGSGLTWSSGTRTVTGTGAAVFRDELRFGQMVIANAGAGVTEVFVVEEVIDNTHFLACELPLTTMAVAKPAVIGPVLYPVGTKRGTSVSGNVIQSIYGHYIGVGQGTFLLNGQALNATFPLSRTPKLAMHSPATNLYTIHDVGISLPGSEPRISLAAVAGTTQMLAGSHSIRVMARNTLTGGYSNPSDAIAPVVITAGQQIQVTFIPAMASDQDAWDIYSSQGNDSTTAEIQHSHQGPWYFVKTVKASELIDGGHATGREAGTVHTFSFLDGEITTLARLISFNNFPPDDALYVDAVNGIPLYFSCFGKGDPTRLDGTCPGPAAVPSKPSNPEGVFLDKKLSMAGNDYIIGEMQFKSRIFCLGQMSLQVIVLTTIEEEPIAFRSLWNVGFRNPYAAEGFKEYIYGFSTAGMVRSVAGGDDSTVEFEFDSDVKTYLRTWHCSRVIPRYDPKNKAMVFFFSAAEKRGGHFVTVALPFLIDKDVFNPPIILEAPGRDRDFIVTGAATVGQELCFIAGGRKDDGTMEFKTYVFDGGDTSTKEWNLCWAYTDDGLNVNTKRVHGAACTGRFNDPVAAKFFMVDENGVFNIDDLKAGVDESSEIVFPPTTGFLQRCEYIAGESPPGSLYAVRMEGSYSESTPDTVDRVDELVLTGNIGSDKG